MAVDLATLHQSQLCALSTDFANGTAVEMGVLAKYHSKPQKAKAKICDAWAAMAAKLAVSINGRGWWIEHRYGFESAILAMQVMIRFKIIAGSPRGIVQLFNGTAIPLPWQNPQEILEWMRKQQAPAFTSLCPEGLTGVCSGECGYSLCYVRPSVPVCDADPCSTCSACGAFHSGHYCGMCGAATLQNPLA